MKQILMLFLVCLLDGIYSNMMETLKLGKDLRDKDPKKDDLLQRFLDVDLNLRNILGVDVDSPHHNNDFYQQEESPRIQKEFTRFQKESAKLNNEELNYSNTYNKKLHYSKLKNSEPELRNEESDYPKPNNKKQPYPKRNNLDTY